MGRTARNFCGGIKDGCHLVPARVCEAFLAAIPECNEGKQSSTSELEIASSSKERSPRNNKYDMKATIDRLEDIEYIS
jgi:hypothetical protein